MYVYALKSSSGHVEYPNKWITGITVFVGSEDLGFPIVDHIIGTQNYNNQPKITQNHIDNHIGFGRYRIHFKQDEALDWGYVDVDFSDADYGYDGSTGLNNDFFSELRRQATHKNLMNFTGMVILII